MLTLPGNASPLVASIVKKQVMALTGLFMCSFLVVHLVGNCLLFVGPEAFNQYAHFMLSNPLIALLEWGLVALFLLHAALGLLLIRENRAARPERYVVRKTRLKGSSLSLVSMSVTGPLILLFLVLHLLHFRFGPVYTTVSGGLEVRDLYRTVVEYFASLPNVLLYVAAMVVMALHVQHGLWSALQSLGINHPRYNALFELASNTFALVILLGFGIIPVWIWVMLT